MKYPHVTSAFHKIMQQCVSLARSGYDEPDQASLANAMLNSSRKLSATQNINQNYNPVVAEADALPTIDKTTQPHLRHEINGQCLGYLPRYPTKTKQFTHLQSLYRLQLFHSHCSLGRP
jgi:hypothetical protein